MKHLTRLTRAIVCGGVVCTRTQISSFSSIESPKVSQYQYQHHLRTNIIYYYAHLRGVYSKKNSTFIYLDTSWYCMLLTSINASSSSCTVVYCTNRMYVVCEASCVLIVHIYTKKMYAKMILCCALHKIVVHLCSCVFIPSMVPKVI